MSDVIQDSKKRTKALFLAVFRVGDLLCGIDILGIKEINRTLDITRVHGSADYIRGVLNLRGEIVTIFDLRMLFGLEPREMDAEMRIVVVRHMGESIGFLVECVDDIVEADPALIEPPPSNLGGVTGSYFSGVYKMEGALVAILNVTAAINIEGEKNRA